MNMINFREADRADACEMRKFIINFYDDETPPSLEAIERSLTNNQREVVFLAFDAKKLIGFCCAQILQSVSYSDPYAEMTELFVAETYRRQGIGRQLIQVVENECGKRGVKHFHLDTERNNIIAQTLYRSCGYVDSGQVQMEKDVIIPNLP